MRLRCVASMWALAVTVVLSATAAVHADHTDMVRPRVIPTLPPPPPLEGPLGTAYRHPRSKGLIRINDACVHIVFFRLLEGIDPSDGRPGTGDEIICHTHMWMDLDVPAFGTLVRRAEVNPRGRVRDSVRLDKQTALCPPAGDASWYEIRGTRCYEADPSYHPSITVPFVDDPTQGFILGGYAPRPASRLIAIEGNTRQADQAQ